MDGRNASGNTPLHVCAVNNQEACARMLLFRGAQRGALNYANQTPYQVFTLCSKQYGLCDFEFVKFNFQINLGFLYFL